MISLENKLSVKTVDFMGDGLLAAKDSKGIIWTGVRSLCAGMGLTRGQTNGEIVRVQEDIVLSRGCMKFRAGVFEPNNETIALQLDYVPLWLAKISITPNMKENNPELVEKLIKYQLKAKDVLAQAFLPQTKPVRRNSKRIGRNKTKISLYSTQGTVILIVGDELYSLEVEEFDELNSLIPMLANMEVSQIPSVVRAYLSLHKESSPKLNCEWAMDCDE